MIYTELTKKAMQLAYDAHHGQLDKSGVPYIFHPFHVAEQMNDEYTVCVALLHDIVEDTEVTIAELEKIFPPEVTEAVRLLTHDKELPYSEITMASERKHRHNRSGTLKSRTIKHRSLVRTRERTSFNRTVNPLVPYLLCTF